MSTSSLCHILKIASARKFVVQRTADSSHLTSQTSDHALNTKLSSTSRLPPQASTVGHTPSHNVPDSKFRRKQSVSNLTLSPAGGQQLPPSVVKEQSLIAQLIMNMIGARLPDKVQSYSISEFYVNNINNKSADVSIFFLIVCCYKSMHIFHYICIIM